MADFHWDAKTEEAAQLLAAGELTTQAIADRIGVTRRTITNWKRNPDFAARIREHLNEFVEDVRRRGLAVRERRIKAMNDRWIRLQRIVEDRADSPEMQHVPGGWTGYIVHDVKGVGRGEDFQLIDLYKVDTGLLAALLALEKQAAQELGQWTEQLRYDFSSVPDDELIARATRALGGGGPKGIAGPVAEVGAEGGEVPE